MWDRCWNDVRKHICNNINCDYPRGERGKGGRSASGNYFNDFWNDASKQKYSINYDCPRGGREGEVHQGMVAGMT